VNYEPQDILTTTHLLRTANLQQRIIVDCSHGNSGKDYRQQKNVLHALLKQIQQGNSSIGGIMLESHLVGGKQIFPSASLTYGQSITDECLSWEETVPLLEAFAATPVLA